MASTAASTTRPALGRPSAPTSPPPSCTRTPFASGEGLIAAEGPLVVRTGKHTGRSPEDKFIVGRAVQPTRKIWWGPVNRPISEADYDRLRARLVAYCAGRDLYSQDCFIGAAPAHRRSLRVYTETAWASIFARNLFRRPTAEQLATFAPNFTIICVPSFQADPADRGHPDGHRDPRPPPRMEIIIVGTEYAGEIKKSAFTVMNYLMPDEGVLPMHSAINVGQDGDSGGLLRPVGDRQDDAVRRPAAEPHRRRRARLGRRHHLQLRGRLLRQDDPAVADVRAGHLPDDAAVRDDPRERRPRSQRPASSTSTRSGSPRTPAARTRSSSSATPTRPGSPARPRGGRLPDRRCVRRAATDLAG